MLEFFSLSSTSGVASLYENYITFNSVLIPILEDAYRVRIAVNKEKKQIHIFKVDRDEFLNPENANLTFFKVNLTKTYARICSKELMNFIFSRFKINLESKFLKCEAEYHSESNSIVINLGGVI